MTNVFALLRLLPVSSRDKDAEILALRHRLSVVQRQLGPYRVRFTPGDRALLATLLHRLPRDVLNGLHLVVRPDTVLRWHRDVTARRHARRSRPRHPGRPRTVRSIRVLVVRLVRENPGGIAGCTASCWCPGSRSPLPPSGRSWRAEHYGGGYAAGGTGSGCLDRGASTICPALLGALGTRSPAEGRSRRRLPRLFTGSSGSSLMVASCSA